MAEKVREKSIIGQPPPDWLLKAAEAEEGQYISAGLGLNLSPDIRARLLALRGIETKKRTTKKPKKTNPNTRDLATVQRLVKKHGKQKLFAMIRQAG